MQTRSHTKHAALLKQAKKQEKSNMITRSQKRKSELESKVRPHIVRPHIVTYGEQRFSDFKVKIIKIRNEFDSETGNKIAQVKIIQKMYELVDKEFELLWPTILRVNSLISTKKLVLTLYDRAMHVRHQIEVCFQMSLTVSENSLLFNTYDLLERVAQKMQPKINYILHICPDEI